MKKSLYLANLPNGLTIWWDGMSRVYIDTPTSLYNSLQVMGNLDHLCRRLNQLILD